MFKSKIIKIMIKINKKILTKKTKSKILVFKINFGL